MSLDDVVQLHDGLMVCSGFDVLIHAPFFASPFSLPGLVLSVKLEESGMGHVNLV